MDPLPELGQPLDEHHILQCGEQSLEWRFTPGHAPGHVVFICHAERWVVGGDVLFRGSVGRTDLPGCNPKELVSSIENQLYSLPDDYTVWPGHGPSTTVGEEKLTNPFVNGAGTGMMQR
jgi:glyoxylase-like metal-dependent hydrolase (beta-lactamase superfamily II)